MTHRSHRIAAAGLAMGLVTGATGAKPVEKKTAWGAAAVAAGVGAVVEASKDRPVNAAVLAAGAVYSYSQYDKARKDDNRWDRDDRYDDRYDTRDRYDSNDPYGYDRADDTARWRSRGEASASYSRSTREVYGRVVTETGRLDRNLRLRLDNGATRTIEVPKTASVDRSGRGISVHELNKNEYVRVSLVRYNPDGNLTARRVTVVGRANDRRDDPWYGDNRDRNGRYDDPYNGDRYDTVRLTGRVNSIDSRAGILRVEENGRRLTVDTRQADIRDSRGRLSLRDLDNGDRVTVEGRRDGDRILATRVTVR